ncbi:hypothetical protein V9K20_003606 [Vibrio cholerae]|nr:hypothetical protein [Vibrio cholerae]KUO23814.1 hypothetical protein AVO51_15340 [Vibrio cholerae]
MQPKGMVFLGFGRVLARSKPYIRYVILLMTIFIFKPFINGVGCDSSYFIDSEKISFSSTCKNGIVVSDLLEKKTGTRVIRRSIYGYWNGYIYITPSYHKRYVLESEKKLSLTSLSKFEIKSIWSIFILPKDESNQVYFFLDDHRTIIGKGYYKNVPVNGFLD